MKRRNHPSHGTGHGSSDFSESLVRRRELSWLFNFPSVSGSFYVNLLIIGGKEEYRFVDSPESRS